MPAYGTKWPGLHQKLRGRALPVQLPITKPGNYCYQYILRCQNTSTGVPSSLWGTELKMDVASGPEKPDEVGLNPSSDMCNVMM